MFSGPGIPLAGQGNPLPSDCPYDGAWLLERVIFLYRPTSKLPAADSQFTAGFRRADHFVARISSRAKSAPCICVYERRRYSGRPSSSMRFSEATAMATSVVCRPLVRECSASPITRL